MQLSLKLMKRCSTLLIIEEIQIETSLRYHFLPMRLANIQDFDNILSWWGCRGSVNAGASPPWEGDYNTYKTRQTLTPNPMYLF